LTITHDTPLSQRGKQLLFETDWLASSPVFYNLPLGLASTAIQEVLSSAKTLVFDPEALYNYLDFGYSVFEQTPVKDLQFMRHSSRLWRNDTGALEVEYLDDPFEKYIDFKLSESDVIDLIQERVRAWEASVPSDQEIVLPLSGGFDSRLLLWCLRDKSRVRAYTYGLSANQDLSTEVVHAQALAKRFGVRWERVPLGDFHNYFENWDAEFGPSTHAHGMYHFEFYSKIRERMKGRHAFLSGIIGDAWAGSILPRVVSGSKDLLQLGYTHGLRADPNCLNFQREHVIREQFWNQNKGLLGYHRFQIVTSMRLKLMLLSYLIRVPRLFNFESWSPYLDIDIAMAMLNLPQHRRVNRQWQRDFFAKVGLDLEGQGLKSVRSNTLDFQALKKQPLRPLEVNILGELLDPSYVSWINNALKVTSVTTIKQRVLSIPKLGGLVRKIGLKNETMSAYSAYLCIRPIENLIRSRVTK